MVRCMVMPEDADIAMVLLNLVKEALTEEICLILAEVHVLGSIQAAIHYQQRMQGEGLYLPCAWVDPTEGTRSLHAEAGCVGKSHREVIGYSASYQALHVIDVAAQVVAAVAMMIRLAVEAVVRTVDADDGTCPLERCAETDVVFGMTAVLRIVIPFTLSVLGEVNRSHDVGTVGLGDLAILIHQPWEGVTRVVVNLVPGLPYISPMTANQTSYRSAHMSILLQRVDIVREVDMVISRFGEL